MSSMPAPQLPVPDPRGSAVIGKGVTIKGQIFSREDLTIDGEVDGSVELHEHRLTIGEKGTIRADVTANEIVVLGSVHGNVEATERLTSGNRPASPVISKPPALKRKMVLI